MKSLILKRLLPLLGAFLLLGSNGCDTSDTKSDAQKKAQDAAATLEDVKDKVKAKVDETKADVKKKIDAIKDDANKAGANKPGTDNTKMDTDKP